MKKFLALCLAFCLFLTCASTTAFAAEDNNLIVPNVDAIDATGEAGIMPCNTDYWTTELLYIGNQNGLTLKITVPKGQNLKVHFYLSKLLLEKMELYVQLLENGKYKTIAHWDTEGHHWADVVTNTNGGTFTVRLVGPAYVHGGFYSEP